MLTDKLLTLFPDAKKISEPVLETLSVGKLRENCIEEPKIYLLPNYSIAFEKEVFDLDFRIGVDFFNLKSHFNAF